MAMSSPWSPSSFGAPPAAAAIATPAAAPGAAPGAAAAAAAAGGGGGADVGGSSTGGSSSSIASGSTNVAAALAHLCTDAAEQVEALLYLAYKLRVPKTHKLVHVFIKNNATAPAECKQLFKVCKRCCQHGCWA